MENAPHFGTRSFQIRDELKRADGDDTVEERIGKSTRLDRTRPQGRVNSMLLQRSFDLRGVPVYVDPVELVRGAGQFGHENAAAVTDLERAPRAHSRTQRRDQREAPARHETQDWPVIPIRMIDRARNDELAAREEPQTG